MRSALRRAYDILESTTLAFALGVVCSWGCGQDVFSCQLDSECGEGGTCQPIGHCSFSDDACASGQRFGDNAGSLSGDCVVPGEGTGGEAGTSTGGTATTDDGAGEATTIEPNVGDSTAAADTSAPTSSGEPPSDCTSSFLDTFDGRALDGTWSTNGNGTDAWSVAGGAVELYALAEDATSYVLLQALGGASLDLSRGWVRIEVLAVPNLGSAQGTLTLDATGQHLWLFEGGGGRPIGPNDDGPSLGGWDPEAHRWVQMRAEEADLVFEHSPDAATWTEQFRVAAPADLGATRVRLTAGHYMPLATQQSFRVGTIEICYD